MPDDRKPQTKREAEWAEAKRRCRLSEEDVRMAKELGLNPRSLIRNMPNPRERWKAPVNIWVREMYRKRQEKSARKKAEKEREAQAKQPAGLTASAGTQRQEPVPNQWPQPPRPERNHRVLPVLQEDPPEFFDDESSSLEDIIDDNEPPTDRELVEENQMMLRRQEEFRLAAECVAEAFARLPMVEKVALIGSVAVPLEKEVPRFKKFRRAGQAIWHECKDVDLAVWLNALDDLKTLQRTRSRALNDLFKDTDIGVAHHQVEVFLVEPQTDRYLGRLCNFGVCPKGKPECLVPGCGAKLFLQQHENFVLRKDALRPDRTVILFDRSAGGFTHRPAEGIPF